MYPTNIYYLDISYIFFCVTNNNKQQLYTQIDILLQYYFL
jgi:hypothetical protein